MLNRLKKHSKTTTAYNTSREYVQEGLAITPSEMYVNAQNGIPISSQLLNNSNFDDGEVSRLTDVPFLFKRGIDVGDVISYEDSCRTKVKNSMNNARTTE